MEMAVFGGLCWALGGFFLLDAQFIIGYPTFLMGENGYLL